MIRNTVALMALWDRIHYDQDTDTWDADQVTQDHIAGLAQQNRELIAENRELTIQLAALRDAISETLDCAADMWEGH